jgi:hypothetical protein
MLVESDMTTAGEVRQVEAMGINGEQLGRRFWSKILSASFAERRQGMSIM